MNCAGWPACTRRFAARIVNFPRFLAISTTLFGLMYVPWLLNFIQNVRGGLAPHNRFPGIAKAAAKPSGSMGGTTPKARKRRPAAAARRTGRAAAGQARANRSARKPR